MPKIELIQGDCLEKMKDIPEHSIDMVLTDPPYGTTACKWDNIIPFDAMWTELRRIIKSKGAICLFGSEPFSSLLRVSNLNQFKYDWIWEKNLKTGNLNARKMPMGGHEVISVFGSTSIFYNPQKRIRTTEVKAGNKKNSKTSVYGKQSEDYLDRQSDTLMPDTVIKSIKCVHNSSGRLHPTQKPVELLEYLIKTYTNEGETLLDFTMGSGSTGVACKNLNRNFIGIELDQEYFKIAEKRINENL